MILYNFLLTDFYAWAVVLADKLENVVKKKSTFSFQAVAAAHSLSYWIQND